MSLFDLLGNSLTTLGFVLLVSWLSYLAAHRRLHGFGGWMGLTWPSRRAAVAAVVSIAPMLLGIWLLSHVPAVQTAYQSPHNAFQQASRAGFSTWEGIAAGLIYGFVMTGSAEELLFRGLIGRRLYAWLGFWHGNVAQALLFGVVHLAMLLAMGMTSPWALSAVALLITGLAAAIGYLDEREADEIRRGSILPGWLLHGGSNAVLYTWAAVAGW